MLHIIDRRLAGKNKSIANRERFVRRFKQHIKAAVGDAVRDRSIRDIEKAQDITIPKKDIAEPVFRHGPGGKREAVHAGNEQYVKGDRIPRPDGGAGGGSGNGNGAASNDGEGEDDFVFQLSREEFLQYFFEDLELPRLLQTQLLTMPTWKSARAGFATEGTPNNLDIVRSLKSAIGRRIALGAPLTARARALEEELAALREHASEDDPEVQRLEAEIHHLKSRVLALPYLDPFDLRYVHRIKQPQPVSQAVMFCLMDVSGSMDEERKDMAKRFFILLYLFLTRNYERIDVVFIRHHTQAQEVSEEDFFHSKESGGTVVSSALELMRKIMAERYPAELWNVYGAQASDGDNWHDDSPKCRQILTEHILPRARYFAYIQVAEDEQGLWREYEQVREAFRQLAMKKVASAKDIYPVFRELFRKQEAAA